MEGAQQVRAIHSPTLSLGRSARSTPLICLTSMEVSDLPLPNSPQCPRPDVPLPRPSPACSSPPAARAPAALPLPRDALCSPSTPTPHARHPRCRDARLTPLPLRRRHVARIGMVVRIGATWELGRMRCLVDGGPWTCPTPSPPASRCSRKSPSPCVRNYNLGQRNAVHSYKPHNLHVHSAKPLDSRWQW
ncbi:hypothetical protein ZEAMMB73_Zm00001d025769 [Zea mays]|uniref:Uncharacterized protein n=1 Tax=Zea mays TaxID=4577 RepID=A0A1D6J9E1_MAIZE|nr:hypothetical protein ZEAMMB73_Zm00001d025769 [Zea mays]AQK44535.1 hypothetical protein ZEAMMB73_Zm00001d025769 [Zea mays]